MISIILVEPENPGNIGAVARVMANFDQLDLVLLNPKADHLDGSAIARSMHAKDTLKKAKIIKNLEGFDTLIATTAKLGNDYNLPRTPLFPSQLADKLNGLDSRIGIVFGRESCGLTNEEVQQCDFLMTIPTSVSYWALNLSHAVGIVCYELFKSHGETRISKRYKPISGIEKDVILKKVDDILDQFNFKTPEMKTTQQKFWKRLIGKSFLTKREAYVMMGFLKKLNEKL